MRQIAHSVNMKMNFDCNHTGTAFRLEKSELEIREIEE